MLLAALNEVVEQDATEVTPADLTREGRLPAPLDNQSKRVFDGSMACPTLTHGVGMHTIPTVIVPTAYRET